MAKLIVMKERDSNLGRKCIEEPDWLKLLEQRVPLSIMAIIKCLVSVREKIAILAVNENTEFKINF